MELAASHTYLKSFWLRVSFQNASQVTVLSLRTSFQFCPGKGCSGMGSPFPAHPPPSSDLPFNQACFDSLFMRFDKACSIRKIDAAASAHLGLGCKNNMCLCYRVPVTCSSCCRHRLRIHQDIDTFVYRICSVALIDFQDNYDSNILIIQQQTGCSPNHEHNCTKAPLMQGIQQLIAHASNNTVAAIARNRVPHGCHMDHNSAPYNNEPCGMGACITQRIAHGVRYKQWSDT